MQTLWIIWIAVVFVELGAADPTCTPERAAEGCVANARKPVDLKLFFKVKDTLIAIEPSSPIQLTLECQNNTGRLVVAALPRFAEETVFEEIWIQRCELGNASVPGVLRALRVRVERKLALQGVREKLRADHFAGLDIESLYLESDKTKKSDPSIRLDDEVFAAIANLRKLSIEDIPYDRPPKGLYEWSSKNGNLTRLYADTLSELTKLYLTEPQLTDASELRAARNLNLMVLTAPVGELPPLPALTNLSLNRWNVSAAAPWTSAALSSLSVRSGALSRLPGRWLAASTALQELQLRGLALAALPHDLLLGNSALRVLVMSSCGLTTDDLPDGLLRGNAAVEKVDLSHNELKSVPGFILRLRNLLELNLSFNKLSQQAAAGAPLPLPRLRALALDYNPLGDTCAESSVQDVATYEYSWLQQLRSLRRLSLRGTRAARLCPDWRHLAALAALDLRHNRLTRLEYDDLRPVRSAAARPAATILLQGNNVTRIEYSAEDYARVGASDQWSVTVKLSEKLACDCHMYWFAASLAKAPHHARVEHAECGAEPGAAGLRGRALRDAPLDALACGEPCAPGCRCALVPARGGVRAACLALPVRLLRPDPPPVVEVSLASAGLRALPSAADLPATTRALDLRNNSISAAGADEARALLRLPALRRVLLAGNPLACRCGQRALVDALLEYKDRVDWESLSCSEAGLPLRAECGLAAGLVALLGVLVALATVGALLVAALAHPKLRARIKTALRVLGVRVPATAPAAPREFDAFVSYAQADAGWVAGTLAPALEAAPAPRRLCLHHRDWDVGELILEQIVRSVRRSRRTLLVVSDAFARSDWARAEFDEAMACAAREARPPPLVVLRALPGPSALAAAPALADYLRAATYLRADDPRFEHKLRAAVPPA